LKLAELEIRVFNSMGIVGCIRRGKTTWAWSWSLTSI